MKVRAARAADAPHVMRLLAQLGYRLEGAGAFERLLDDPAHVLLVADAGGDPVGFANVNFRVHLHHEAIIGTLDELIVDEGRRSGGIGAALVEAVLEEARSRGARTIELASNVRRERAHGFYERCGFERRSWKFVRDL